MRATILCLTMLMAAAAWPAGPAQAQEDICFQLWHLRNSIYKGGGYCFKTPQAIRVFGNAGCQYDDVNAVPLSTYDRQRVATIQERERALGCRM